MAQAGGAPVFNGTAGTPRLVPDPGTDHLLPPAGNLNYGSISSLTALSTTNGVAASVVHGDHFEMMNGNEFRTILLDREHTVKGNQVSTVVQDRHDTVQANYNQHTIGTTQRLNVGGTTEFFVDEHANSHQSNRKMEEPETVFHSINEWVENANKITQNYGYKTEFTGAKTDICIALALGLTGISVEHVISKVEGTSTMGYEYGPVAVEAKALEQKVGALRGEVDALKGRMSDAELDIQDLYATPFAIGIYI